MWKNIEERGRPQMAIWRMHITCCTAKITDTLWICKTYCFSTATMVTQTHLNVTLRVHFLSCFEVLKEMHVTLNIMWEKC